MGTPFSTARAAVGDHGFEKFTVKDPSRIGAAQVVIDASWSLAGRRLREVSSCW
jgi:hypothetical protein